MKTAKARALGVREHVQGRMRPCVRMKMHCSNINHRMTGVRLGSIDKRKIAVNSSSSGLYYMITVSENLRSYFPLDDSSLKLKLN